MDTLKLYEDLAETLAPEAARKIAGALGAVYEELRQSVTQADFADLKAVVAELAEAQRRTEQQVRELAEAQGRTEQRVRELAEAQSRTEDRLSRLEQVVSNLAEAQNRTEQRVRELAEAQSRTEDRLSRLEQVVSNLAEAQSRTEQRVRELAEAQSRTEVEVRALARGLKAIREMVAGLSDSVGYGLENRAMARLPAILEADHGVRVEGRLVRRLVEYPEGGEDEVNILGEGRKGEVRVSIVGEAKTYLAKRHVDELLRRAARLEQHGLLSPERLLVAVTHLVRPEVQRYANTRGVVVVPSYLLEG